MTVRRRVHAAKDDFAIEADRLKKKNCRFRMFRRKRERVIKIRDYGPLWAGAQHSPHEFSAPFRWQDENGFIGPEEQSSIELCAQMCLDSHAAGRWLGDSVDWRESRIENHMSADGLLTWPSFAGFVREYIWQEVLREGTRKNYRHLLEQIARWSGPVTSAKIRNWVEQTDPKEELGAYRNRRDLIGKIHHSGAMPLEDLWQEMGEQIKKIKGGRGKKKRDFNRLKPRAIPADETFERWFDAFPQELLLLRTVFVLIAVYGLRPHEVWHIDWLRESGIAHIRYGKTGPRILNPVPMRWVERYDLPQRWKEAMAWMRTNSKLFIKPWPRDSKAPVFLPGERLQPWIAEIDSIEDCWNSDQLGEQVASWMRAPGVPELWGETAEGRGERTDGKSRAISYDPRHAFAIRCYLSPETSHESDEVFAKWMGHTVDVHKDTYRRWMPLERQARAAEEAQERRVDRMSEASLDAPLNSKKSAADAAPLAIDEATWKEFQEFQKFKAFQAMQHS